MQRSGHPSPGRQYQRCEVAPGRRAECYAAATRPENEIVCRIIDMHSVFYTKILTVHLAREGKSQQLQSTLNCRPAEQVWFVG